MLHFVDSRTEDLVLQQAELETGCAKDSNRFADPFVLPVERVQGIGDHENLETIMPNFQLLPKPDHM